MNITNRINELFESDNNSVENEPSLIEYQERMKKWCSHNFTEEQAEDKLNLLMEELGELAKAFNKGKTGIKGTPEYWLEKEKDAVGDIILTLLSYCNYRNFAAKDCIELAWNEIKTRDYQKYPNNGKTE